MTIAPLAVVLAMLGAAVGAGGAPPLGYAPDEPSPNDPVLAISGEDAVATRNDAYTRMTVPVGIASQADLDAEADREGDARNAPPPPAPYRFLVDTGAQNTVIGDVLAAQLALPHTGHAIVMGVAGSAAVDTVTLPALTLGRRRFPRLLAPILATSDIEADGIIGLDALQDERIVLDFVRRRMTVVDAAARASDGGYAIVVLARRKSGQLIITTATIDGVAADVILDTGAQTTIGNRALQRALAARTAGNTSLITSVTGQAVAVELQTARRIVMGQLELGDVTIAYADAPPFAQLGLDRRPAILLGMDGLRAFRRVAIDFSRRKVLFDLPPAAGR